MCLIIVPLAGPDFYTDKFGIRPLYPVGGATLIEHVLGGRPWLLGASGAANQLVFVLRDEGPHTDKMRSFIAMRFPLADIVILGSQSAGAPLTALAGIALSKRPDEPVIIDLADIAFDMPWDAAEYLRSNPNVYAVVPYFTSGDPKFSYVKLEGVRVLEAREKQVISANASAGVYFFRDVPAYLRAMSYCLQHPETCRVGPAFFVCPTVNGLIEEGRSVHGVEVANVEPISALFHGS